MENDLSTAPTSAVLRMLQWAWRDLYETPQHLYPLLHASLRNRIRVLHQVLSERADSVTIAAEELELVGDEGSLDDALWRLQLRLLSGDLR